MRNLPLALNHATIAAGAAAAALAGCASSRPAAQVDGPYVQISYVAANNDLSMTNGPTSFGTNVVQLKPSTPDSLDSTGPFVSTAAKCNADHSVCKHGIVSMALKYTIHHADGGWVIDGNMVASLSRSATVAPALGIAGQPNMTFTRTLPDEFPLIDDEPVGKQHFRWKVSADAPLELRGPAGALIRMQEVSRP